MNCVFCVAGSYQSLLFRDRIGVWFGREVHFEHEGLLQHVHDIDDVLVFGAGGPANNHIHIRVGIAQIKQLVVQGGEIDFILVQIHVAAVLNGDVVNFRFRVLWPLGGVGEISVKIVHNRCGGNDKNNQEHKGQIEQRGDVQLR